MAGAAAGQTGPIEHEPASEEAPVLAPLPLPWPPLIRERAALRPWGASPRDAASLAQAWSEPDIVRWCSVPDERDEAAAARWIAGEGGRRDSGVAMDLVITEPGVPEVVLGEVGFAVVEPERYWAEIGFWLFPGARGSGRAAGAVDAFADWVLADLPVTRLIARAASENPASAKVVERAGFERAGELPDGTVVYVLDKAAAVNGA